MEAMSAAERLSIEEKDATLAELLDRAERGEAVAINRGGRPVAQLVPAPPARDPRQVREALEKLAEIREKISAESGPITLEEILALRHEGHRYAWPFLCLDASVTLAAIWPEERHSVGRGLMAKIMPVGRWFPSSDPEIANSASHAIGVDRWPAIVPRVFES